MANNNHPENGEDYCISYDLLFEEFSQNYWNLIVKYNLKQMRPDGKSIYSKVEQIFKQAVEANEIIADLEFENAKIMEICSIEWFETV